VRASPGSYLQRSLLVDPRPRSLKDGIPVTDTSIPWIFSTLRNRLQDDIDKGTILTALQTAYKKKWVEDIDRGLRAWPLTSHEIARALFFNPSGKMDRDAAVAAAERYKNTYLLSMMGLPDFFGLTASLIAQIRDLIIPPQIKQEFNRFLQEKLLDVLLVKAFGMTSAQMMDELKDPRLLWPSIMEAPRAGMGTRITLAAMNRLHLQLGDTGFSNPAERFDVNKFAPAYNTMLMSKLVLISNASASRLITDLAKPPPVTSSTPSKFVKSSLFLQAAKVSNSLKYFAREVGGFNLMLGFDRSMDDGTQWKKNPEKMQLYSAGVFDQVFLKQAGD